MYRNIYIYVLTYLTYLGIFSIKILVMTTSMVVNNDGELKFSLSARVRVLRASTTLFAVLSMCVGGYL